MNFAVLAEHKVKIEERENWNKYLDIAGELRKLWNISLMVIPIVISAIWMVYKGLEIELDELEIGGLIEITQTIALLILAKIFRRVWET